MSEVPAFVPSRSDVAEYIRMRQESKYLNLRITNTVPEDAIEEIARALGMYRRDAVVLSTPGESALLMDCCIYDWIRRGKNLVELFRQDHPPAPGGDEAELLEAGLRARYRIMVTEATVEGAGVRVRDVLSRERFFLMDVGVSKMPVGFAIAARTLPLREYWITTGAGLPVGREEVTRALEKVAEKDLFRDRWFVDEHKAALTIIRSLRDDGASERIAYEDPKAPQSVRSPGHRHPSRNAPCVCGSGRRYKGCCGKAG